MSIRPATIDDHTAIGAILAPIFAAGETYTQPRDISQDAALDYWFSATHRVFVLENEHGIDGTYYLRGNQTGAGAHVANAAFAVRANTHGGGGRLCAHALDTARSAGFIAMQFNFVVGSNTRAIALWQRHGFQVVGTLPDAFQHPTLGMVAAFVMFRRL